MNFIKENFKTEPTLKELSALLKISYSLLSQNINKFGLNNLIEDTKGYQRVK